MTEKNKTWADYSQERERIFKKIDLIDDVIHVLEATANTLYSPKDEMWNTLLKARDKLKKPIEKEKDKLFQQARDLDDEWKKSTRKE